MKLTGKILAIALASVATVAIAAEATDPTVKARQETMDGLAGAAKILGGMAKGEVAYDKAAADEAKAALVAGAKNIPVVFKDQATDPKSTAKPDVWTDWSEFTEDAGELLEKAEALDTASAETIGAGMGAVGAVCGDCHKEFRTQ